MFKSNPKFKKPIDELEEFLRYANIPYERRELYDGYQICVPRFDMRFMASTVCHRGSYGHEQGRLEFYDIGSGREPVGGLSPIEAYELIADYLDRNPRSVERGST